MCKTFFSLIFTISFFCLKAQQNYFAILQTQNQSPFYIRYNAKPISSSLKGYLILPKLTNGEHIIKIGFPKSTNEEITFPIFINGKDEGFTIQVQEGLIASLQNIQNNSIVNSINKNIAIAKVELPNKVNEPSISVVETKPTPKVTIDSFTSINQKTTSNSTPEIVNIPKVTSSTIDVSISSVNKPTINETPNVDNNNQFFRTSIKTNKETEAIEATYIIKENEKWDTIVIQIPLNSLIKTEETKPITEFEKFTIPESPVSETPNKSKSDITLIDFNNTQKEIDNNINITLRNSDCTKDATETDAIAVRKKMSGETEASKMNTIAIKAFKKKCYTSAQVIFIGVLFIEETDKFNFYKLAYPFVSDSNNFKKLHAEFKSLEIIEKFNSLFKK